MKELQQILGYDFKDISLLASALVAPAVKMNHPDVQDNQRLEFLGDAVVGLLSAEALYAKYATEQEGRLTIHRAHMVSTSSLAAVAERIGLRKYVRVNHGATALPRNSKVLTDAMEAVMGAVYLDGGLDAARKVFVALPFGSEAEIDELSDNPKGLLQTVSQSYSKSLLPVYELVLQTGPSHCPQFTFSVSVKGLGSAVGTGGSRKAAETKAAENLLMQLRASGKLSLSDPHLPQP